MATRKKKIPVKVVKPDKLKRVKKKRKPGTGTALSALDKILKGTAEEIEEYWTNLNSDENLVTSTQMEFALEYLDSGFKIGPSYKKAVKNEDLTNSQAAMRGQRWLCKTEVISFLEKEIMNRRIKSGVTHAWVVQKYKSWADFDCTEFFKVVKSGNRYLVELKCDLDKLPEIVRKSIQSLEVDNKTGSLKIKFIDQRASMDMLSKLLGFANDKLMSIDTEAVHLHFDRQDEDA